MPTFPAMASLSHRQGWSCAVLLLQACLFVSPNLVSAQSNYRTGTSEVRITFFVTDEHTDIVPSILPTDLAVVDSEMVIRDFRSLSRSNETELDIVILADASASVAKRFAATRHDILHLINANQSGPAELSILTFGGTKTSLVCSRDCASPDTVGKLQAIVPSGATPLNDALLYAANLITTRRAPGVRQVLLLFSDGDDTISRTSAGEALHAVVTSGALLYTVDSQSSSSEANGGSNTLQRMAEMTGGRSLSLQDGIDAVLQAILEDLRSSYVVTYRLPNKQAGFHSIQILPRHNLNLRFHSRRGYFYEASR